MVNKAKPLFSPKKKRNGSECGKWLMEWGEMKLHRRRILIRLRSGFSTYKLKISLLFIWMRLRIQSVYISLQGIARTMVTHCAPKWTNCLHYTQIYSILLRSLWGRTQRAKSDAVIPLPADWWDVYSPWYSGLVHLVWTTASICREWSIPRYMVWIRYWASLWLLASDSPARVAFHFET